jgi:hypothetical protein
MLAVAAITALVGGCAGTQPTASGSASTPSPPPMEAITPVPAPARVADLSAGAAALDGFRSYRYTQTVDDPDATLRGVVVNGDPHRVRSEAIADGTVASVSVEIGEARWISFAGSNFVKQDEMGGSGDDPWQNPVASEVESLVGNLATVVDAGTEDRAGLRVRHLHGTAAIKPASDAEGPDGAGGWDYGFVGSVDAWLAVDDGHLVALRAAGVQLVPSFGTEEPEPSPSTHPYAIEIAVDGIDDPANVVDEPPAAAATARPSRDQAAAAIVAGIAEGMRALDRYVIEATTETAGLEMTATLTVVSRPEQAAMSVVETGMADFPDLSILVIGDRAWSRSGDDPWEAAADDGGPTCGQSGQSSSEFQPCTFALMTGAVTQALVTVADTFTVVATDDVVDGTGCTHLRSDAGMTSGEMTIPGTTDIWVANDGGYLVKDTFAGAGISTSSVTKRVNDPAVVLEPPTP